MRLKCCPNDRKHTTGGTARYLTAAFAIIFSASHGLAAKDEAFTYVVMLRQAPPTNTIVIDHQTNELWLTLPGKQDFRPLLQTPATGSGLLCALNNHPYLVTAAHVAKVMQLTASVIMRGTNDMPQTFLLNELTLGKTNFLWTYHKHADVAAIPLAHPSERPGKLNLLVGHFADFEILDEKHAAPDHDEPLTVIGFPLGLGVDGHFSPHSKSTFASSGLNTMATPAWPTNTDYFFLQDPTAAGYSGAPVFNTPNAPRVTAISLQILSAPPPLRIYGICSQVFWDDTGGKIGLIVPSYLVRELLGATDLQLYGHPPTNGTPDQPK